MYEIYKFLEEKNISYQRFDHPAVFTCEEADRLCPKMPGAGIKNLFLRNKDGKRHFLVVVGKNKSLDLKSLREILGVAGLSFASEDRLQKYLQLTPGSVTLLGLMNDPQHAVEVIIDEELRGQALQCHPLINTATLVISAEDVEKFLRATGHEARFINLPVRS